MSRDKGEGKLKRFFVQAPADVQKRLRVLAIQLDTTAEKLGGILLERAVTLAEADRSGAGGGKSNAARK